MLQIFLVLRIFVEGAVGLVLTILGVLVGVPMAIVFRSKLTLGDR